MTEIKRKKLFFWKQCLFVSVDAACCGCFVPAARRELPGSQNQSTTQRVLVTGCEKICTAKKGNRTAKPSRPVVYGLERTCETGQRPGMPSHARSTVVLTMELKSMRTMSFAVLALMTIGLLGARPASAAAWTCVGPEYVCGSSKAASPSNDKPSYKSSKSASARSHKPSMKSSRLKSAPSYSKHKKTAYAAPSKPKTTKTAYAPS